MKGSPCPCGGVCAKSFQSCRTPCHPMDCSLPGSSVHGILQARVLERVVMPSSRGSFRPRDRTLIPCSSCIAADSLLLSRWGSPVPVGVRSKLPLISASLCVCVCVLSLQSCPVVCDLMDCSPPDSSVHGILQARILEWAAMPSSRGSSQPRDRTLVSSVSCIGRWVLHRYRHLGNLPR